MCFVCYFVRSSQVQNISCLENYQCFCVRWALSKVVFCCLKVSSYYGIVFNFIVQGDFGCRGFFPSFSCFQFWKSLCNIPIFLDHSVCIPPKFFILDVFHLEPKICYLQMTFTCVSLHWEMSVLCCFAGSGLSGVEVNCSNCVNVLLTRSQVNFQLLEIHPVQLYNLVSLLVLSNDKLKFE